MMRNGGYPPSAIQGASLLSRTSDDARKEAWPYTWDHCPPDGEQQYLETVVDFPANNVLTQLLSYPVPDGLKYRLWGLMFFYTGGLLDGQSLCSWQLAVNTPANVVGITTPVMPSGYSVPYWGAITISKGAPSQGLWTIPGKLVFQARDVVSVNVTTIAPFPNAGGQFLTAIQGWTWPAEPSS
jgi:hypothetical protein